MTDDAGTANSTFSTSTASTVDGVASTVDTFQIIEELPMETEPGKEGFVLINGNTWLPKPLYAMRRKQQKKMARKNEKCIVWTK